MKSFRYVLFFLTVLLVATAAQAQQTSIKAHVPFDFFVGSNSYLAGEYTIILLPENRILICNDDTHEPWGRIYLSRNSTRSASSSATPDLLFHRIGDHYFLYQVWSNGNPAGGELVRSRAETQFAKKMELPEAIAVAAKSAR